MKGLKLIKPEQFILALAILVGSLYLIVSPPFQVPDSPNHFYRAYQLSQGNLSPISQNRSVGGFVPRSFDSLQKRLSKYRYNPYAKMRKDEFKELAQIELNETDKVFAHFPNTAVYSPISYIPQTLAMYVGRKLELKPLTLYYWVRVSAFLCWLLLLYATLRFIPIKKYLLGILVLLPMSLFINSSFSADMMINGLSLLYLAIILNLALTDRKFTLKLKLILLLLIVLIGLSKLVYIPIVLLVLIIPSSKFSSIKHLFLFFMFSGIIGGGAAMVWKSHIDSFYTSYLDYNPEFRDHITLGYKADMNKQLDYIKANKMKTIQTFGESYVREFQDNFSSYIGNLGWNRFRMPYWFIGLAYFMIFLFAFTHSSDQYFLSVKQKIIMTAVVISSTGLVMLSQYLTWNEVGSDQVWPMMGRYFTPVYPMLFLLFSSNRFKVPKKLTLLVFIGYVLLASGYSLWRMDDSFYVSGEHELVWEYDFDSQDGVSLTSEHTFDQGKINGNHPPLLLDSASMKYGLELTEENPYGYTVSLFQVKKGDKVEVTCWKTGDNIRFVFDDKPTNKYYVASCYSSKLVVDGYEYITETYFCKEDFEELKIYLYNPSNEKGVAKKYTIQYYRNY